MPLYDYSCRACGLQFEAQRHIDERLDVDCPACGGETSLLITCNKRDWFRPHWNEHINPDREIYVESKEHYRQLCKQNGVQARCL